MSSCWLIKIAAVSWLFRGKTAKKNGQRVTKHTAANTEKDCIFMIINTGRFIMLSVITNIYKKKPKDLKNTGRFIMLSVITNIYKKNQRT